MTDVKPGNLIVFDESLTDDQTLECTSLLFSTSSGSGGDGESTAEWSTDDVATFTEEHCGTNPSGMNEGVPVSTSVCQCYLEKTAEKYTSDEAWIQAGMAAGFDFSNEWYTDGFAVLADCGT